MKIARPTSELLEKLRRGKAALRTQRRILPLPEKVRRVLELQRIHVRIIARRRTLLAREEPWKIRP